MTTCKRWLAVGAVLLSLIMCLAPFAGATESYVPYQTYTYGWSEWYQWSPHAYTPVVQYNTKNMLLPVPTDGTAADLKEARDRKSVV